MVRAADRSSRLQLGKGLRRGERSAGLAGNKTEVVFMEKKELEPLVLVRERDC